MIKTERQNKRIGFTTSLPVEVILAAGHTPVDVNNLFITSASSEFIRKAEMTGFPRTVCSWIKGNYVASLTSNLDELIGIVQGDCSNTHSLLDMLTEEGIKVSHFSFPLDKTYTAMDAEIKKLEAHFEVDRSEVMKVKKRLDKIRERLIVLDEWTWKERLVSGAENHYWLVNTSDFMGNPDRFEEDLEHFMNQAQQRDPLPTRLRIAYIGVPPIYANLYQVISDLGGDIVFNEVQRQFAMPYLKSDIVEQYLHYTYPYSVFDRLKDIEYELLKRHIDAVISYTQSFCHLQIDNIILKRHIDLPFLTLEGDQPEDIDSRTLLRLESFFEIHG
ncbi:MAG: 2-hydroxyglutaryl-CoA dehydratase [Candidatus Cloacimonetes bacterium HGW-Cloacimonetes-1]|jgi:benzoyl-CoA reductase/2-hydroxyglutaryl-CoA dehydratase subunit BcrC/BadD/HgdB|nr:MAG: 2-hydroxyglutaryl-CoA dehydratase [Candidatus Cloacimonetes bacterium HGW-Cloacimonetes-1]